MINGVLTHSVEPVQQRRRRLKANLGLTDRVFRGTARGGGAIVLAIMVLVGTFLTYRALQALRIMRLPVVPTILRSRAIYQSALEGGRSAEETGDAAAAREVAEFWAFIERFAFAKRDALPPTPRALRTDLFSTLEGEAVAAGV